MEIVLNGQRRTVGGEPRSTTLDALIVCLQMKADRIAVERNGAIVPRAEWQTTQIHEGDRLEIVHFVGGGW